MTYSDLTSEIAYYEKRAIDRYRIANDYLLLVDFDDNLLFYSKLYAKLAEDDARLVVSLQRLHANYFRS